MKKNVIIILAVVAVVLVVVGIVIATKGGNTTSNSIVGSWKYEGADYTYTFNADGTGNYNAMGTKMEFTYTTEGNKLSITYTGNTVPFETEYSIEGKTLNVKDSFGTDTIYKKQ